MAGSTGVALATSVSLVTSAFSWLQPGMPSTGSWFENLVPIWWLCFGTIRGEAWLLEAGH